MSNFLLQFGSKTIVALTLVFLVFSPFEPLLAQAQSVFDTGTTPVQYTNTTPITQTGGTGSGPTVSGTASDYVNPTTAAGTPATAASAPSNQATTDSSATPPTGCSWSTSNWDLCLTDVVYAFTVGIGSGFAYVAAYFFDFAIQLSLNGSAYALSFVSQGWTTARDLANMAFLFILLYIAFMIMFQAETSGTLSMLAAVIVVALLVNFSFFFTRLVIDAGNILAIQFYNAIQAPSIGSTVASATGGAAQSSVVGAINSASNAIGTGGWASTKDLTSGIMGMLNLQGLFNTTNFQSWYTGGGNASAAPGFFVVVISLSFLYIAAGIMFWLLTVAFIANGVKFLVRIVVLWFLIIASPLAFIAKAIPNDKVKGYYGQWQSLLIQHSFYPAVFMFIFLMLTNFSNQMACATAGSTATTCPQGSLLAGLFSTPPTNASSSPVATLGFALANVAIRLGFVIAVLYIGLEASKKIGVMGAHAAESAGSKVGGWFKASTSGFAARTGGLAFRETVGRGAQNNIDYLKANPPKTRFGQYFDFATRRGLASVAKTSVGGTASYTDIAAYRKERGKDWDANTRDADNRKMVAGVEAKVKANEKAGKPREDGIDPKDIDRIQNLGKREIEAMSVSQVKSMSGLFTEGQMKIVKEMDKLNDKDKDEARLNWENNSKSAPLRTAQEEVKTLRDIRDELKFGGGVNMPGVDARIAGGATMNLQAVKDIRSEMQSKLADERDTARDRTALAADRKLAEKNAIRLQQAINKLGDLEKHVDKISVDVGGKTAAKEFEVKA